MTIESRCTSERPNLCLQHSDLGIGTEQRKGDVLLACDHCVHALA